MNDPGALDGFIGKWRARWPEWRIAEVFVPASQRDTALAWFALLQELTDAAWSGEDSTPGLAKLAWWQEELQGWSQGRRRHPLGAALQPRPAPWMALSAALPALRSHRVLPRAIGDVFVGMHAFADAVAGVEDVLFDTHVTAADLVAATLLAAHPALSAAGHEPLRTTLLSQWPAARGPRVRRIVSTLAHARLRPLRETHGRPKHVPQEHASSQPLPPWRTLWLAWHAARG